MEMIRTILFSAIILSAVTVKAQTPLSFGAFNNMQPGFSHFQQLGDSTSHKKKWIFQRYAGISTGFVAFHGGSGTFLSAPVGVQVYRPLSNNVYAFADVSIAPTFVNFNGAFYQPQANKSNGFMNANNFGIYSTARMGLMYINDDRTFSISGSIGVSRGNYYNNSPFYAPGNSPAIRKNNNYY